MTSAAVVSFPTVGMISKVWAVSRAVYLCNGRINIAGHTPMNRGCFVEHVSPDRFLYLGVRISTTTGLRFSTGRLAFAAIIAFPMAITEVTQLWISPAREVIVGILCGGLMMMIPPSTSDGTTLLTALKICMHCLLEHASLLWQPKPQMLSAPFMKG